MIKKIFLIAILFFVFWFFFNQVKAYYMLPPEVTEKRLDTITSYQGETSGQYSDSVTLKASLEEKETGKAIAGKEIKFVLESQEATALTDNNGIAQVSLVLNQGSGDYSLLSIFGGDDQYKGSSDSVDFKILKEDTTLEYIGPTSGTQDSTVNLKAKLSEIDSQVGSLKDKKIIWELGSLSRSASTNSSGEAQTDLKLSLSPGSYNLITKFEGDALYLPSSDNDSFEVEAKPGGGGGGGGCFIATAAYGSPEAAELKTLRKFRDYFLLTNRPGQIFVASYYKLSPPIADYIADRPNLKRIVRWGLNPIIKIVKLIVK